MSNIFKSKSKVTLAKLKLWYKYDKLPDYIQGYCFKISKKYTLPTKMSCDELGSKVMKHVDLILLILELSNKSYSQAIKKLEDYIQSLERI